MTQNTTIQCEVCEEMRPESEMMHSKYPGYDGPVYVYFCEVCA